jgi:hypothetical protein
VKEIIVIPISVSIKGSGQPATIKRTIRMPKIERYVSIRFQDKPYDFHNCESSDFKSKLEAIHDLEKKLGMMRGGLVKHFKDNPDDIVVVIK